MNFPGYTLNLAIAVFCLIMAILNATHGDYFFTFFNMILFTINFGFVAYEYKNEV